MWTLPTTPENSLKHRGPRGSRAVPDGTLPASIQDRARARPSTRLTRLVPELEQVPGASPGPEWSIRYGGQAV